jgi:type IV pilus assembly protein PilN
MENPFKNLFKKKAKDNPEEIKKDSTKKKKNFFGDFLKNKLGKSAVQGEEIVGVELTPGEIRLAQLTSNKSNQWVLDRFYVHKILDADEESTVLANPDKIAEELKLAIQKSKINTTNAAIAIPVTSAIIRVVTAPLMTAEELLNAIQTDSLWENLVQLTDNLDDYSIFHQIISRNEKANTMDILFVASKLSDINSYTDIVKKGGLNVVIIDVKCFALKSAVDQINHISGSIEETNLTAILEFGLDENYVMILHENNPIITDIFIRGADRKTLLESNNQEEMEILVKRYITQVKQAIQDFETRYEKRIRNLKVTSNLSNVDEYLASFRKIMTNTGFNLFDPLDGIKVPAQFEESVKFSNRSYLSSLIGLAFRKLDVFGYFKFVTAVKSINLLPNRSSMLAQKKAKIFSNYAFKGITAIVSLIYIVLFGLSFWQINSLNKKIVNYEQVMNEHVLKKKELDIISKELAVYQKSLDLSKSITSNKKLSFRILAQIASAVPKRVKFKSIKFEADKNIVLIEGTASGDQDILKLISNLNGKKLVSQATLTSMTLPSTANNSTQAMKGFKIICKLENA